MTLSAESSSEAATVPTAVWFSAADSDADDVNSAASFTSVTVTMTVCDAVISRSPVPDVAVTATTYLLSAASFWGSVLAMSVGDSKSGADLNDSAPAELIENRAESAPDSA